MMVLDNSNVVATPGKIPSNTIALSVFWLLHQRRLDLLSTASNVFQKRCRFVAAFRRGLHHDADREDDPEEDQREREARRHGHQQRDQRDVEDAADRAGPYAAAESRKATDRTRPSNTAAETELYASR